MLYEEFKEKLKNTKLSSEEFYKEALKKTNVNVLNNYYEKYIFEVEDENDYSKIEYYLENKSINIDDTYSENSYKNYVNEVSKIPVLTKEERIVFLQKIDDLNKKLESENITKQVIYRDLRKINYRLKGFNCNLLNKCINEIDNKEIINKIKKYYVYEELVEKFMEHNLKLVIKIANTIVNQRVNPNEYQILDLIQNGNMGLRRAIEKYNISSGFQFSTYAFGWIKQFINRGICSEESTIVLPVHLRTQYKKLIDAEMEFEKENKRKPTDEELSKILGYNKDRIPQIRNSFNKIISLDTPVSDEDDITLSDFIPDENNGIEERISDIAMQQQVQELFSKSSLSVKEQIIIILRFGLDLEKYVGKKSFKYLLEDYISDDEIEKIYNRITKDNEELTLKEVSEIFDITRERVRQLECKALREFRNVSVKKRLLLDTGYRRLY